VKAKLLREIYPQIVIPDFSGSLNERMVELETVLSTDKNWVVVGSSFGGLMGVIYTSLHPENVEKLILFAPALTWPDFAENLPEPIDVPTLIIHGKNDEIIPHNQLQSIAEQVFSNHEFMSVDDDHGLYKTVHNIDWKLILEK
jgi:pimeloyl-ACP methyl ester carboxylesterase